MKMGKREYAFSYLDIIFIWTNMRKEYQKKRKHLIYFNISVVEGVSAAFAPYRVRPFGFAPTLYRVRPHTFRVRPHQVEFAP